LFGNINRVRPRFAVILALYKYKLPRFTGFKSCAGSIPGALTGHAMRPESGHPDGSGLVIHQNGGLTNSILIFRQPAPLIHLHVDLHGLPASAAVRAPANADITIAL